MDMTAQPIEVHLCTDANNLVTTAASTHLPEKGFNPHDTDAETGSMQWPDT